MSQITLTPYLEAGIAVKIAAEIYEKNRQIIKSEVFRLIEKVSVHAKNRLTDHDIYLREKTELKAAAEQLIWCTYPLIVVRPYNYLNLEDHDYHYFQRSSNFYGSTFSKLDFEHIRTRLTHNLERIQRGIAPGFFPLRKDLQPVGRPKLPIYVGESSSSIPLSFAIGERVLKDEIARCVIDVPDPFLQKKIAETIKKVVRDVTAATNLVHISDRVVDAADRDDAIDSTKYRLLPSLFEDALTKRHRQLPKLVIPRPDADLGAKQEPAFLHINNYIDSDRERVEAGDGYREDDLRSLAVYDALRTDYSCARLEHYGHTEFQYFQDFALLTNYKTYVKSFLRTIIEDQVREGNGRLYLPSFEIDDSVKRGLNEALITWLDYGTKNTLFVDKQWVADHVSFPKPGESHPFAPIGALQGRLTIDQWIGLWVNNFSSQMPAYHYVPNVSVAQAEEDRLIPGYDLESDDDGARGTPDYLPGVTLVNIGVGPSNAKNFTDNLAVLRPIAWLMIGHCGGLRTTQKLGDFVLAQGYVRDDGVLKDTLPHFVPVPEITEVTEAFREAAAKVLYRSYTDEFPKLSKSRWFKALLPKRQKDEERLEEKEWRRIMLRQRLRVGTVITTHDRNWELDPLNEVLQRFDKARAIAIDMESATIAANGFRHRVFYGTLLCVSDRPLFGDIKMRGMATSFYEEATRSHLQIGLEAVKLLLAAKYRLESSRKISGLDDPPLE